MLTAVESASAGELFLLYSARLESFIARWIPEMLCQRNPPADLAQDVWERALPGLGAVHRDDPDGVWPYLCKLAQCRVNDLWRIVYAMKKRRERPEAADTDAETVADYVASANPTPPESLVAGEDEKEMQTALAALPADWRRALDLRVHGRSYREIAAESGGTEKSVERTLHRARRRLRELLSAAAGQPDRQKHPHAGCPEKK